MDIQALLKFADHTLLNVMSTEKEIRELLDDGIKYHVASCCIPPNYVKMAKNYAGDKLKICTVIGFPNGYNESSVKVYETCRAVKDGADEIDMVINIGALKSGKLSYVLKEIREVKSACKNSILKVIVESCLLTEEEKVTMCHLVTESGAEFIKTSTGFSTGGATFHDVKLFKKHIGPKVKVKAAGGISSIEDAERFINLGAERLGTSKLVKIAKEMGI